MRTNDARGAGTPSLLPYAAQTVAVNAIRVTLAVASAP